MRIILIDKWARIDSEIQKKRINSWKEKVWFKYCYNMQRTRCKLVFYI